ncbi:hypothetical protein PoB_003340000 [Plakobranchus ocellatus]|uniref:SWIM-type domain-containing protein n=1 Tax=Plakobranchus ocellatus TaxID=259542 RepID=A0AAV4AFE6_9GAST|nr:hypothetical protein PoB_003340000 [Plakobranchus ocellatus]
MLSGFEAQLVKVELELSDTVAYAVSEDHAGMFTVSYKDKHHTTRTTCSYSTFGHLKIPCRYIFTLRRYLEIEVIPSPVETTDFYVRFFRKASGNTYVFGDVPDEDRQTSTSGK